MIVIQNLNKIYENKNGKVHALKNINLEIKKGEIFGIIGLSGAGKSTLIRCINLLEKTTSGNIFINKKDITLLNKHELREIRKSIGMIFQHFNLLNSRTVFENVAFPLEISGYSKKQIKERVENLLSLVELSDKKNAYPSQLSGGQKQRVAIARALANQPDILLCDEATSALDPKTTKSILKLLKEIQSNFGLTIVIITHQMEVIRDICDRVAIIENGEIIELDTVETVFTNPKTKIAKAFISHIQHNKEEICFRNASDSKVIRLKLLGEIGKKPVISQLIRHFSIDINILSGNINELQTTNTGTLLIQLYGKNEEIENAIKWLKKEKIEVEVVWNG
ncbi:methionine ABC transporter ATP-binding protein [Caloranaerobacter azorensis H53214]|uniref:Methionine ABC transporter ATP-binding protein n=1 Tax=Caloranaerobacter azorensis H53214 TaxID=1156417 RepID=A0A096DPY6_9FIRM|nr:methionine ABC transporter ATP-binding protein [Caloranaerobacter azorensis]KGG81316.1 methionine ABC transporter ATP-binding protein [Caloranaerobacter azorensis H53214]